MNKNNISQAPFYQEEHKIGREKGGREREEGEEAVGGGKSRHLHPSVWGARGLMRKRSSAMLRESRARHGMGEERSEGKWWGYLITYDTVG